MEVNYLFPTLIKIQNGKPLNKSKIAAFDLDNTLIKTKSNKAFPIDKNDWEWKYDNVKEKLQNLVIDHDIYIITNQAGVSIGKQNVDEIIEKIKTIIKTLDIVITVYIATAKDYWRKPNTSIFEHFILEKNPPEKIFYVGDAAGRVNDHADTDRKLAYNLYSLMKFLYPNLKPSQKTDFYNDTIYFSNSKSEPNNWKGFDPVGYLESKKKEVLTYPNLDTNKKYIILLIGPPGSGKSTLSQDVYKDFTWINLDRLGTINKCLKLMLKAFEENKSIVIDNINPTQKSRDRFINLSPEDYTIMEIVIKISREVCEHLNVVRDKKINFNLIKNHKNPVNNMIPSVVYNKFYKMFELPKNPYYIDFVPKFTDKRSLMYFLQKV